MAPHRLGGDARPGPPTPAGDPTGDRDQWIFTARSSLAGRGSTAAGVAPRSDRGEVSHRPQLRGPSQGGRRPPARIRRLARLVPSRLGGPGSHHARSWEADRLRRQRARLRGLWDRRRNRHRWWAGRELRGSRSSRRGAGAPGPLGRAATRDGRGHHRADGRCATDGALGARRPAVTRRHGCDVPGALAVGAAPEGRTDDDRRSGGTGSRHRRPPARATAPPASRIDAASPERTPPHGSRGRAEADRSRPARRCGSAPVAPRDRGRGAPSSLGERDGHPGWSGADPLHEGPGAGLGHPSDRVRAPSGAARSATGARPSPRSPTCWVSDSGSRAKRCFRMSRRPSPGCAS